MARAIEIDTRQHHQKHKLKHEYFEAHGFTLVRTKLYVGDYRFVGGTTVVDTKKDIAELAQNLRQSHERFRRECENARDAGYTLIVLVENIFGVVDLETLSAWLEPEADFMRRHKRGAKARFSGGQLSRAASTMQERYGVRFEFCHPRDAGRRVIELLEGGD